MTSTDERHRRREQQRRWRARRRRDAHETAALLAGELDRPSLAGLLLAFAAPLERALLPPHADAREHELLLQVAAMAWNAALALEDERLETELATLTLVLADVGHTPPERARALLDVLVRRRHAGRFAREPRSIAGVEVTHPHGREPHVVAVAGVELTEKRGQATFPGPEK